MRSLPVAALLGLSCVVVRAHEPAEPPVHGARPAPAQPPQPPAAAPAAPAPAAPGATPPASGTPATSPAQPAPDDAERKKLEEQLARELGQSPGASAPAQGEPQPPPGGGPAAAPTGGSPYARLLVMPDLSAIGSFAAAYDTLDVAHYSPRTGPFSPADRPEFTLEELEVAIQAVVDPYARADAFLSFTPEGVDVEEAYATMLTLPAGLQLRAGKLFAPFGRQNQQHPHVWEFVDAPLAQSRLLAPEAFSGAGVDLAWLAPLPWFAELHVAAQSTADAPPPFPGAPGAYGAPRLTGVTRLVQWFALGEANTLGVGLSAARREEPGAGGAFRDLGGVDVYLRHRPPTSRSYAAFQAELYARRFRGIPGAPGGTDTGGWAQAFFRRGAYLGYGVRYDFAPSGAEGIPGTERRFGAVGAWYLSEFQRIRLQLSYDRLPDGKDGLEALLHLEFGIGAHGAHPF